VSALDAAVENKSPDGAVISHSSDITDRKPNTISYTIRLRITSSLKLGVINYWNNSITSSINRFRKEVGPTQYRKSSWWYCQRKYLH